MTVVAELSGIINLLEAQIPANPRAPRNERAAKELERQIKQYFSALENALSEDMLEQLYFRYVVQEAKARPGMSGGIDDALDPILAVFHDSFQTTLEGQSIDAYLLGSAQMTTWGQTEGGIPIAYEGPPIQEAVIYAEKHCAELVTQMDEETKRRLAKVISDGIENKRGIPGLRRDIRNEFLDMRRYRADMIARTETSDALSQAFMDRAKAMGIDGKEVIVGDPCDLCRANADEGVVPIDHIFSSGHQRTPFHPNCVCALAPVRLRR